MADLAAARSVLLALCFAAQGATLAQTAVPNPVPNLVAPADPTGRKTDGGIVVSSVPDGFEIELSGRQIRPLEADRLVWDVDGRRVELLIWRRGAAASPATAAIGELQASTAGDRPEPLDGAAGPSRWRVWTGSGVVIGAAAIGTNVLVMRVDAPEPAARDAARDFARRSLATLRPPTARNRPDAGRASPDTGAPLQGTIALTEAVTGERYVALLNGQLATSADRALRAALVMDAGSLTDFARWFLAVDGRVTIVNVFDGQSAHAINLIGYDFASESFAYFDPWAEGSFLQKEHNAAGVDARPHPTLARTWLVSFAQLQRVLYAVVDPERSVIRAMRLCALADATREGVFDAYREPDPSGRDPGPTSAQLENAARYLDRTGKRDAAIALLAVRMNRDPSTAPGSDLTDIARQGGVSDLAAYARTLAASAAGPAARPAVLVKRDAAESTEFFRWFHLQSTAPPATVTRYRPGGTFASLVEVTLTSRDDGAVGRRALAIRRSFIDDPANAPFAADITKSFLLFADDAPTDEAPVRALAGELFGRRSSRVPIPGAVNGESWVPVFPSPGIEVYRGARQTFRLTMPANVLEWQNEGSGDQATLNVIVMPR